MTPTMQKKPPVKLAAIIIADIHKTRWQVELFFKWIMQNLKIKSFVGTSKNAVMAQVWIALCVCWLLAYLKFQSKLKKVHNRFYDCYN